MPESRVPRQRDIARIAGVSQAAVSMVLNGRAATNGIPASTEQRVRAAMDQLGYVPNAAARSLKSGRNGLIGVYTFERVFPIESSDYYHEFLNGVEAQAVDEGLDLVLFASTQRADGSRSIYGNGSNRLRLADGAILLGFEKDDEELARLAGEGYPFMFIGYRDVPGVDVPHVTADYRGAMQPVAEILAEFGHTHVAYVGLPVRGHSQLERLTGIRESFAGTGITTTSETFLDAPALDETWLSERLREGATAVIVESFQLARALSDVTTRMSVQIPSDLSVVSLDTDPVRELNEAYSHVYVPRKEMGRRAVTMLTHLIMGALDTERVQTLECGAPTDISVGPPSTRTTRVSPTS